MKDNLKDIRKLFEGINFGNRVSVFFALLVIYYIFNLLTSSVNSGMSGGLEAEHNVFNQVTASILAVFTLYYAVNTKSQPSYSLVTVTAVFLIYVLLRTYFGFVQSTSRTSITYFSHFVHYAYWGAGLIFCMNCFKFSKPEDLRRLIQMLVWVYLVFVTYRLFTQKGILARLSISAGVNSVGGAYMIAPLIIMAFKDKTKIILFLYVAFICIFSAKRQAAAGMAIVSIFSLKNIYQSYFNKRKFLGFLLLAVVLYFGSDSIYKIFDDLNKRQEETTERDNMDSGRTILWQTALDGFERADNNTKWFGGGPRTGQRFIGEFFPIARAPHSGFVQALCDYGYVGLVLYVAFFLFLIGYVLKVKDRNDKLIYLSIVFSWLFCNLISHPTNMRFIFLAIGIGYIFYKQNLKDEENQLNPRSPSDPA